MQPASYKHFQSKHPKLRGSMRSQIGLLIMIYSSRSSERVVIRAAHCTNVRNFYGELTGMVHRRECTNAVPNGHGYGYPGAGLGGSRSFFPTGGTRSQSLPPPISRWGRFLDQTMSSFSLGNRSTLGDYISSISENLERAQITRSRIYESTAKRRTELATVQVVDPPPVNLYHRRVTGCKVYSCALPADCLRKLGRVPHPLSSTGKGSAVL